MERQMTATADLQPLSSVGVRSEPRPSGPSGAVSCSGTRPLALRVMQPAPHREVSDYVYDSYRQIATDSAGVPLVPNMTKQWTTDGTHTDGDGGDNEGWGWEEV
jgi:putative ATP-grasp target RiPP